MSLTLQLRVIDQKQSRCRLHAALHNQGDTLSGWTLHFSLDRFVFSDSIQLLSGLEGAPFEFNQVGAYYQLTIHRDLSCNALAEFEFEVESKPMRFSSNGVIEAVVTDHTAVIDPVTHSLPHRPVKVMPLEVMTPYTQTTTVPSVEAAKAALIPLPSEITVQEQYWSLPTTVSVALDSHLANKPFQWLTSELSDYPQELVETTKETAVVRFCNDPTLPEQAYKLTIQNQTVVGCASSEQGFFHCVATLLQLVSTDEHQNTVLPEAHIQDHPAYQQRGFMLDCARHFHNLDSIKRQINQCARYKLNTFHWHLTDDEGWRIEIKRLPELTNIGAWRGPNEVLAPQYSRLTQRYGGYYSQAEVKEVVAFASARGVTVIPEVDIPGHCRAAILSLPELLIEKEDRSEYRSVQHYSDNVLNPGLAGTYQFLDIVLEELAELFPAYGIHIGADEVPENVWERSPSCQALMKQNGYQHARELQGHLLRYAQDKLHSLGKRMLGWEEVHQGEKVSKDAVVYSWQSEQAGLECAQKGYEIVLQPAQFTYLDMVQDYAPSEPGVDWATVLPLEKAYHYQPLANVASNDAVRDKIRGIQCSIWCEHIPTQTDLEFLIYPRLQAIAEVAWTRSEHREWCDFLSRLKGDLKRLKRRGINYRSPW